MLPGTRIDPASGAIAPFKFRTNVEQMTSDIDGLVYLKSHSGAGCSGQNIYRMDHEGKLVPFADGHNGQQTVGKWGNKVPQDLVDAALFDVAHWTGRGFQMGIGVAPNGDVYSANFGDRGNKAVGPLKGPTGGGPVIYAYSHEGKMKGNDLVQDTPNGTYGVRADRQGNIYLGLGAATVGSGVPRGLDASASKVKAFGYLGGYVGTVVKVKPGSKCVWGDGPFAAGGKNKLNIEGLLWSYYGQSTLTAKLNCCVCPNSQFDLDYFARVFVPQAHCSSVAVLDTNGNEILRVGRYGNADSQGPQSLVPKPEIGYLFPIYVTVSDKALYVADLGNARIVRADLGYHAIGTAPLR
jgi:hypothetical protein